MQCLQNRIASTNFNAASCQLQFVWELIVWPKHTVSGCRISVCALGPYRAAQRQKSPKNVSKKSGVFAIFAFAAPPRAYGSDPVGVRSASRDSGPRSRDPGGLSATTAGGRREIGVQSRFAKFQIGAKMCTVRVTVKDIYIQSVSGEAIL